MIARLPRWAPWAIVVTIRFSRSSSDAEFIKRLLFLRFPFIGHKVAGLVVAVAIGGGN